MKTSKHLNALVDLLSLASKQRVLGSVLEDLLTPAEVDDLYQRIEIVKGLLDGTPQRAISRSLRVSTSKVTRGASALRRSHGGFKKVLK